MAEFDSKPESYDDGSSRSTSSRDGDRSKLEDDVKRFLEAGGEINSIEANVSGQQIGQAGTYGSRPI